MDYWSNVITWTMFYLLGVFHGQLNRVRDLHDKLRKL